MSIPLDRLYNFIESIAQQVRGDNVLIYRFYPHGSKKIETLWPHKQEDRSDLFGRVTAAQIYCYDQEPLDYDFYQQVDVTKLKYNPELLQLLGESNYHILQNNLRSSTPPGPFNIYDKCVLLHSEKRSENVQRYQQDQFIPAYYWNHAILALDWFRYAEHQKQRKRYNTNKFLIYNRAWSGTREYRVKLVDLLVEHQLIPYCQTKFNSCDPETQEHYRSYQYRNRAFTPVHTLEDFLDSNLTNSHASADFNLEDYENCDIEVVLETLFDDSRLHLTEKSLRPIAVGQPFILCATHGSLEYLRSYGFKTFSDVIDESYDTIKDPVERLKAVVLLMKDIASWDPHTRIKKIQQLQMIADYNRNHFFSEDFYKLVENELRYNLSTALDEMEQTNTCTRYINFRKQLVKIPGISAHLTEERPDKPRKIMAQYIALARKYYNKHLNK